MARAKKNPPPPKAEEPPQKFAANKVELARELSVSRQTIYDWSKLPGAPVARSNGKHSIEEWREFQISIGAEEGEQHSDKRLLENRRLEIQCRRMEFKFACEREEFTANEIIGEEVRRFAGELIAMLRHEFEGPMPKRCASKKSGELKPLFGDLLDRVMRRIHTGTAAIDEKFPAPAALP